MKDIEVKVEKINGKWYVSNDDFLDMKIICEEEMERLNNIRNKAIEYIKNNNLWTSKEASGYSYMKNECNELLEILKGSDKE